MIESNHSHSAGAGEAGVSEVPSLPSLSEAVRFWAKLGWISFGGPAGQIAIMHREIVERRRWVSADHFLHALNFCMMLPGPEAQQLVTYLGWRLHGARGGIAAGALFVLPSIFILLGLSWFYMAQGGVPWVSGIFEGLIPAVMALVAASVVRIGRKALKTKCLWALAALAFLAIFAFHVSFIVIVLTTATLGYLGGRWWPKQFQAGGRHGKSMAHELPCVVLRPAVRASWARSFCVISVCMILWWAPVLAAGVLLGWEGIHLQQGLFFSKAALVTFGGAYAVLPYVSQMAVVNFGWLGQGQMMAGLGLAETTPGPLIMVLQFVGFVAAWQHPGALEPASAAVLGALITTWVTFLPSFLFVFMGAPHVERLGEIPAVTSALTGITAGVVGVILNLAIWFAWHALWPNGGHFDYRVAVMAVGAWIALERFKLGVVPVLAACALIGVIWKICFFEA
jgi:chromate transporter